MDLKTPFSNNQRFFVSQKITWVIFLDIKEASETAKKKLAEVLNKKANSTISISKEGEEWLATVEIIDEEFLPGKNLESMSDLIGVYEVKLDSKGEVLSYNKKNSHKRGQ